MAVLLETLASRLIRVDVLFRTSPGFVVPAPFGDTIHLEPLPEPLLSPFLRRFPARLRRVFRRLRRRTGPAVTERALFGRLRGRRYSAVIGVDPFGITLADQLIQRVPVPLAYVSFEMLFEDEVVTAGERALFETERTASRRAVLILVPDEDRARLFCQTHSVSPDKVITAPVAARPQDVERTDYLRRRLGIPEQVRIVLYSGALENWAGPDELPRLVGHWPEPYRLVIHHSSLSGGHVTPELKRLGAAGRVYVSTEPLPRKEFPRLLASADFGLALYRPVQDEWWTGKNIYHLGLSSGKVSLYAMCGLPILARSLPVFEREFARYRCGEVYRDVADTGGLLRAMDARYAAYRDEAHRFYRERLNPVEGIERFCDRLIALAGAQRPSST